MNETRSGPSIRRILVGLDASRQSLEALEIAARLAADLSADLMGLFVEDPALLDVAALPVSRLHGGGPGDLDQATMARALRVQARRAREAMAGAAERSRVRWSFKVARGDIGREILAATAECDLVTIGRTSAATAARARLGTTARFTAAEATCAVLLQQAGQRDVRSVAVVYDGDSVAIETAAWLAQRHGRKLLVLIDESDPAKAARIEAEVRERLASRQLSVRLHRLAGEDLQAALGRAGFDHRGLLVINRRHRLFRAELPEKLLETLHCAILLL